MSYFCYFCERCSELSLQDVCPKNVNCKNLKKVKNEPIVLKGYKDKPAELKRLKQL